MKRTGSRYLSGSRVRRLMVAVMTSALMGLGAIGGIAPAQAADQGPLPRPEVSPAEPGVVFSESFDRGSTTQGPLSLSAYVGTDGMTYTADPYWLDRGRCNGMILDDNTPFVPGDCDSSGGIGGSLSYHAVKELAPALAKLFNGADPQTFRVLSAYTLGAPVVLQPGQSLVELQTRQPIQLAAPKRFITIEAAVVAKNCSADWPGAADPALEFAVVNPLTNQSSVVSNRLNPCDFTIMNPEASQPTAFIRGGVLRGDRPAISPAGQSQILMQLRNYEGSDQGNDHAIGPLRVLDVTPRLSMSFSAPAPGENVSTLTYTITNTSDLLAKDGWRFGNLLPNGLLVAPNPNVRTSGNCPAQVVAGPRMNAIFVSQGKLPAGEAGCSISVDVSPAVSVSGSPQATRTFNNSSDRVIDFDGSPDLNGLVKPQGASVTFSALLPQAKDGAAGPVKPGESVQLNTADLVTAGSAPIKGYHFADEDGAPLPGRTLTTPAGTWTISPDTGVVSFTAARQGPLPEADSVSYVAVDAQGQRAVARITVTLAPADLTGPTALPLTTTVAQQQTVRFDLAPKVTPGSQSIKQFQLINPSTGKPQTQPGLRINNVGEWVINPATGRAIFTPVNNFTGRPPKIDYLVTDAAGLTSRATITVKVGPRAVDYAGSATPHASLTFAGAGYAHPGSGAVTRFELTDPGTGDPTSARSVSIPGQGTWKLDARTGDVTFTAAEGFRHSPLSMRVRITDAQGLSTFATLKATPLPYGTSGGTTTAPPGGDTVTPGAITPDGKGLGYDVPKLVPGGVPPGTSTWILDPATGKPTTTVTIPGQGTWTVDPGTGKAVFTPEPGFAGKSAITFAMADPRGKLLGTLTLRSDASQLFTGGHPGPETLPETGSSASGPVWIGALLMVVGSSVLLGARRRRNS